MMNSRILIPAVILLLVAGLGFYMAKDLGYLEESMQNATSTAQKPGDIIPIEGGTIEIVPSDEVPAPELGKPVVFTTRYDAAVEKMIRDTILKLEAEIKGGKDDFETWNNLATYRKQTGDYAVALDIWGYLTYRYSQDPVPFLNRANLYAYHLKDFPKAEADFKRAVSNLPSDYQSHYQLVLFCRDVLKDAAKVKAAVAQAKKNLTTQQYSDIEKLVK